MCAPLAPLAAKYLGFSVHKRWATLTLMRATNRRWNLTPLAFAALAIVAPSFASGQNSPVAVTDTAERCTVLYTLDDPRLFDFVRTRRDVSFREYEGMNIRRIDYITLPVFNESDPDEDNWLYRGANWLHVSTKSATLSRQVLMQEGAPLTREKVQESERILRDANYLYDAMILPATVCADSVDLLVVVRDVWTLQLEGSISRSGGDDKRSIGIAENNLLGTGHGVYLSYDAHPDRKGIALGFESAHLVDGHTELTVKHVENDDGTADQFTLERPFYAIDTPWEAGVSYKRDNKEEEIETADLTTNQYDHHTSDGSVHVGMLLHRRNNRVRRLRLGISSERDSYDNQHSDYLDQPLPPDRTLAYTWLEFEREEYDYWTTLNLNQLFRNEDINLGAHYTLRLGTTSRALGSTENGWVGSFSWKKSTSFGDHHVLLNRVSGNLFYDRSDNRMKRSNVVLGATYDHFIDDRNRWHVDLIYQAGFHLEDEDTFIAGGTQLRGFENKTQRGDRFTRINLERRHFYSIHPFNLFRVGSALFFEAGRAWDSENRFQQSDSVLYDVGIGLRISSSKSRPGNVIHVNLAVPLNERDITDKYLVSFYTSTVF